MSSIRKMLVRFGLACVLLSIGLSQVDSKLSDYITICKAKDPKLEQCLISSGHQLFKRMEKGIPEYDIQPVDPMAVPKLSMQRTELGMSLVLINSSHTGLASTKINKAMADPEHYKFEFHNTIPQYSIIGRYDVNGKVMLLPINGRGDSNITLYDIDCIWKINGEPQVRDGVKYMKLKEFTVSIAPKNMKVRFENLFNGNQLLGETMNELLNTHWKDVFRQIRPALEKSYAEILFKFGDKIFSKTPYNEIFSDL